MIIHELFGIDERPENMATPSVGYTQCGGESDIPAFAKSRLAFGIGCS